MYFERLDENATPAQINDEYREAVDIFPSLHKYKKDHNTVNLQKLCAEIGQFCRSVYASTRSEEERKIYREMVEKI